MNTYTPFRAEAYMDAGVRLDEDFECALSSLHGDGASLRSTRSRAGASHGRRRPDEPGLGSARFLGFLGTLWSPGWSFSG